MAIFSAKYYRNLGIFLLIFKQIIITAQENDGLLNCSISNDSTRTAIARDTEDMALSCPSHKNYLSIRQGLPITAQNSWNHSLETIVDIRWEFLPLADCVYEISEPFKYYIPISIQEGNYLYMCEDSKTCHKFSVVDNSLRGPYQDNGDKNQCNIEREENCNRTWRHFVIRRIHKHYFIYRYPMQGRLNTGIKVEYILITGKWKIHDFYVYSIKSNDILQLELKNNFPNYETVCYGLLVKALKESSLTLELKILSNSYLNVTNKMVQEWQEINLCTIGTSKTVTLLIKPNINSGGSVMVADVVRHHSTDFNKVHVDPYDQHSRTRRDEGTNGQDGSGEVSGDIGPVYYRFSFTLYQAYNDLLSDHDSDEFKKLETELVYGVEQLYEDVPGKQIANMVNIRPDKVEQFHSKVTMDLSSANYNNKHVLQEKLYNQILLHRLGKITVSPKDFIFSEFGNLRVPICGHDEFPCRDGTCVPFSARCDSVFQCPDGSDEIRCERADRITLPAIDTKQLIVYSTTNNSAKLRFPPDSKINSLKHYTVASQQCREAFGLVLCHQIFPCEIWTGQICVECNNLHWNTTSTFWVHYKGKSAVLQAVTTTGEKGPSAPKIIDHFWNGTSDALTLTFIHPDIPNGRITHFDFNISGNKIDTYNVVKENLTYTHAIKFPEIIFSSDVNISVSAHNKHGESSTSKIISSPLKTPKFLEEPTFVDMPCIIKISQVLDKDTLSNMYIVLTRGNELQQPRPLTEFEEKIFRCGNILDRDNSRIIQNISREAFTNNHIETIDACSNLAEGDELQSGSNLFILLENTYNGNSRCKTYSIVSEVNYNSLYSILIVPIIGIIIFIVYKLKKSKSDVGHTYAYATNLSTHSEVTNDVAVYEEVDEAKTDNNEYQKNRALPVCPTSEVGVYEEVDKAITDNNEDQIHRTLPLCPTNEVGIYEEVDKGTTDNNEDRIHRTLSVLPVYDEVAEFGEPAKVFDEGSTIRDSYLSFTNSVRIHDLEDYMETYMKTQEFEIEYKLFDEPWRSRVKQENKRNNRDQNLATYSPASITSTPDLLSDKTSTYINAIKVDGFRAPSRFIVTQYPSSETVGNIWRLIDEHEISLMICLNELDFVNVRCCKFYPEETKSMQPVPFLDIESVEVIHGTHYTTNTLSINNSKKQNQRIMKVLHVNEWKYNMLHPETPTALLMTYEEMNCLENNKVLIACHDAKRASGLFTAMCCLIDQIKMENVCDVSSAVRTVRRSRAEFVPELEQFVFLYNCALAYVKENEKYCNIRNNKINF